MESRQFRGYLLKRHIILGGDSWLWPEGEVATAKSVATAKKFGHIGSVASVTGGGCFKTTCIVGICDL